MIKKIKKIKKIISVVICIVIPLAALTACGNDESENSGNLLDATEPAPGDIYAQIKFLDYDEAIIFKLMPELAPRAVEEFTTRAERGYYDQKNIHRVIPNYLIQGGSLNFDGTDGSVEYGELFPVETSPNARNFYGALCLAADDANMNYIQFYVVTNKSPIDINAEIEVAEGLLRGEQGELTEEAKLRIQANLDIMTAIPLSVREQYLTRGGIPEFDGVSSVFGQLISGENILDAVANSLVAAGNAEDDLLGIKSKPVEEIIIESVTIVRVPIEEEVPEETTSRGRGR